MGAQVALPDAIWQRLTWAWWPFFVCLGVLNIVIAYTFPLETWVSFKVFGTLALTVVFVVAQALWIGRYAQDPTEDPS
jgi:intracellular septation protein